MQHPWRKLRRIFFRLRGQLFAAYFALFAAFFIAILLVLTTMVRGLLIQQIGGSRLDVLRQIGERVNLVKTSCVTLSNLYAYEITSHYYLEKTPDPDALAASDEYLNQRKEVYDEVFAHIGLGYEVLFFGENGFSYSSSGAEGWKKMVPQQLWFRRFVDTLSQQAQGEVCFSSTFAVDDGQGKTYHLAAGRVIEGPGGKGLLLVIIDEKILQSLYASALGQGSEIFVYDQDGMVTSHSDKKMLGKQFFDSDYMRQTYGINDYSIVTRQGEDYLLSTFLDEQMGWTILEMIPTVSIFGAMNSLYWMIGGILAAGLALAMALSVYMARRVAHPLIRLSDAMDKFGTPEFVPPTTRVKTQEIDHLQQSFTHMAGEIDRLMAAVQEREEQKRTLEMNFLRAQINPHFLYNMLFSIRCTIEVGKSEQAAQMLSAFTDLLRSTLTVKDVVIPLQDELESTRKYLVVQKLRYGQKVNYEFDVQPGTELCMVPPLILQPLVENAIFHGLEAKPDADMLVISTALREKDLLITVTDDGAGMDEQALKAVQQRLCQEPERDGGSIGLANVHSRIRLNCGAAYGLTIDSVPGIGTTVIVKLPVCRSREGGVQ